jgi:hypothetical protein
MFTNGNNTQKHIITNMNENEIADHHHKVHLPEISKKETSFNLYTLNPVIVREYLLRLERMCLLLRTSVSPESTPHHSHITNYVYLDHSTPLLEQKYTHYTTTTLYFLKLSQCNRHLLGNLRTFRVIFTWNCSIAIFKFNRNMSSFTILFLKFKVYMLLSRIRRNLTNTFSDL